MLNNKVVARDSKEPVGCRKAGLFCGSRESPTSPWRWCVICSSSKLTAQTQASNLGDLFCNINPHVEVIMAPHAGFDTETIKQKARKDLLNLLEGVSKAIPNVPTA